MPTFTYKALKKEDNTSYENTVEAKDRFEVYTIVRKEGGQVLSVAEATGRGLTMNIDVLSVFRRVKEVDKILLTRNLGAMLTAGLSMSRALDVMERQTKNSKLKAVIEGVAKDIERGGSLSSGMLKYPQVFSKLVTSMVAAGEEAGTLAESLKTISTQLEQAHDLKRKIRGAMIYPSVIVSVLLGVGILMMVFIVPTLTAVFKDMDVELPLTTQIVMGISDFLVAHLLLALVLMAGTVFGFIAALRTAGGKRVFETVLLHTPLIGMLVRETNSARTGRTLSSLLSAGVNMLTAIEITRDVLQNSYYKEVLDAAQVRVQKGQPLAQIFAEHEHLYPPLVGELVAVGEETGALPDMLKEVGQYYENEVGQKTKNMSTIIEPFLMLIVGGGVGFFAVSMISPIYSITTSIQ